MKRPRRPVKRTTIARERRKLIGGVRDALMSRPDKVDQPPAPATRDLAVHTSTVFIPRRSEYRWMVYPDDAGARDQLAKDGVSPVPYTEFGGALPAKDGVVHFQGMTLMKIPERILHTSVLTHRIVTVSLTITEKVD